MLYLGYHIAEGREITMKCQNYNEGWKFWEEKDTFALVWNVPDFAESVTLPHDAMLEKAAYAESPNGGNTGFRDGGVYHYVKYMEPREREAGRTILLKFDGIYMNAMVYVNGELAAGCPYGYTGFYVPLDQYLRFGEKNEIRVIVHNSGMANSRWYSGSGIYRDVFLLTAGEAYIEPEGVQVTTERLGEDSAVLSVSTVLNNRGSRRRQLRLVTQILDKEGFVAAWDEIPVTLFENDTRMMVQRVVVDDPEVWSCDTPYLYQVRSYFYEKEDLLDKNEEYFGIRTLSVDAKHGFLVNGKSVKFRGACIHHDSGILGAATFYDAEYRRIRILKEAGFNAVRMSHHPAAPMLLRACDELGMYVMDEAFDMWERSKSDHDYSLFFDEWWEKDVEAMVRNDYNHPSVVMYSIGNEIPEIGTGHGAKIGCSICEKIRELDKTRPTLAAVNGIFAAGDAVGQMMGELENVTAEGKDVEGNVNDFMTMMDANMDRLVVHDEITKRLDIACANLDIAGYNYMTARYELDGKIRPNRVIVGSETYPPEIGRNWELVEKYPHVIGDFTWTGWDYIGEAGVGVPAYRQGEGGFGAAFPCQLAYVGDVDITGFRRPASYYREIVFGLRKEPYIAVQNPEKYGQTLIKTPWVISDCVTSWTYPGMEGKPVVMEVYSSGDEVELFLNGKSLGRKEAGRKVGFISKFETIYRPGTLEAVTYKGGQPDGRMRLATAERDTHLYAETEEGKTGELVYIAVVNRDAKGVADTWHKLHLFCHVEGAAEVRFGSGDPKATNNYVENETDTWNGRALLIVRRTKECKPVKVMIWSDREKITLLV